jgi:long-subunit acyl-CoA synthetase (AMP-forming)/acyl carrier protein
MTFYEKIIQELEHCEQSLATVYNYAFRFSNEALFEWNESGRIHSVSYGETQVRIETVSAFLHRLLKDVLPGTPVGIYLPNGPDWVVSFWSLLRAGYRPLLLNLNAPHSSADRCLKKAGAPYVISETDFPSAKIIRPSAFPAPDGDDFCDWADEILLCTSGTTGEARIIGFSGKAVCGQIRNSGYVLKRDPSVASFYHGQIKLLAFLPFYHIFGLSTVLLWFSCFGRTFVLLPSFSPEAIRETCRLHEVTHLLAPPVFWHAVADGVLREAKRTGQADKLEKGVSLSIRLQSGPFPRLGHRIARFLMRSVRKQTLGKGVSFCVTGGGAIRKDVLRLINGIGYPLRNGYGMTEIGIASVDLDPRASERIRGTIGNLFPSMEGKLEEGTLRVRGATCFCASYQDGKRTPHDPLEWFDTKDCVSFLPDGRMVFAGRQDDMLNGENGERISPAEIESLFGSPLIAELCVISLPDDSGRERITLIAEPKMKNTYAAGILSKQLYEKNDSVPRAYRVDRILFSEQPLPLTSTMKVQTSAVREQIAQGILTLSEAPRVSTDQDALYTEGLDEVLPEVIRVFETAMGLEKVGPDDHFQYDLFGDSLTYFSLLEQLRETFGISFPSEGANLNTPREFAAYILKESE